jgi:hypothetical protein
MGWRWWTWPGVVAVVAVSARTAAAQSCDCRSGYSGQAAWYAVPSDTGRYVGYYVGGGSPFRGDAPLPCEGVWGWDYSGIHCAPRILLLWNHGRLYQGGTGAYRTDGPRFLEEHKEK